jgi:hypothetical protein
MFAIEKAAENVEKKLSVTFHCARKACQGQAFKLIYKLGRK